MITKPLNGQCFGLPEGGDLLTESYVNPIPTVQGGTHVNGLRQGVLDAMREFCEFHNLLPRGIKLTADAYMGALCLVLSVKMQDHSILQDKPKSVYRHVKPVPLLLVQ